MQTSAKKIVERRAAGDNIWLKVSGTGEASIQKETAFKPRVLETEEAVGQAMPDEIVAYAGEKTGDITLVLLGGRVPRRRIASFEIWQIRMR